MYWYAYVHIKTQVSREAYRYLTACSDQYIYTQYQEILPQYLVKKIRNTSDRATHVVNPNRPTYVHV